MNNNNQDSLMIDLENDLIKKTFEELIYIYYNQEHYVSNFTQNGRLKNQELLMEVKKLNEDYENKKIKYNNLKNDSEKVLGQFEAKIQELRNKAQLNSNGNNSYGLDNLIYDMENYIQNKLKLPKEQLIKDFVNKNIQQKDFEEKFKKISYDYHYYNLILEQLYQIKRLQ